MAACTSLAPSDIVTSSHGPVEAGVGLPFFFAEVTGEALTRATPDLAGGPLGGERPRRAVGAGLSLHLYATRRGDLVRCAHVRAAVRHGILDPRPGSANAALCALLLSLGEAESQSFDIVQGVEMGRPSQLTGTARRAPDGVRATIGGGCVMVRCGGEADAL